MRPKDWDKIADKYFDEIESPFEKGVKNPLLEEIKRITGFRSSKVFKKPKLSRGYKAIDLGCGIGNLVPFVNDRFSDIVCMDFSPEMISIAKKRFSSIKNAHFEVGDMKNMKKYHNGFDYAFAINSIVEPSIEGIKKAFSETRKVLRKEGIFYGIFPALESDILRAAITYDRQFESGQDEAESKHDTKIILGYDDYDFLLGFYENKGKQKHYFKIQLEYRMTQAGFKNIQFEKVEYPWKNCVDEDLRDHKGKFRLFDWFVKAQR